MACSSSDIRPTLPSIHDLRLPDIRYASGRSQVPASHALDESHELPTLMPLDFGCTWSRARQSSVSSTTSSCTTSSCTTSSRAVSPSDIIPSSSRPSPYLPPSGFRLVHSTFDDADALVIIPPSTSRKFSPAYDDKSPANNAILLVGPAMERVRRSHGHLSNGVRVHPYRIAAPSHRRSSTSSSSRS
ncbi:hypothetical protein A0H81_12560 [Grifola frondosa]|uniref:Uncharacterized protein n=1 Tax=Grifola frondosa TaxID=5627 RepID=A0A1C7LRZ2_GRIFR|nr:hypothetical protein A0H81_12560 [Grifola frondosa]